MEFEISNGCLRRVIISESETEVVIPNNVKFIGDNAFFGCSFVEKIIIPSSVKSIYKDAFSYCKSLKEIYVPDSVNYIGEGAFNNCKYLKKVRLPSNLDVISDRMFAYCPSLKEVVFPLNSTKIGKEAFYHSSLTDLILPDSIEEIGEKAFRGSSSLKNIKFPASLRHIGEEAFAACNSLEKVDIPDFVELIMYGAFEECYSLTEVHLPSSVEEIMSCAFYEANIEKIIIPDATVGIYSSAFQGCEAKEIYFGDNLEEIGDRTFAYCSPEKIRIGSFSQLTNYNLQELIIENMYYFYINDDNGEILAFSDEQHDLNGYTEINYNDWYMKMNYDDYKGEAIILSLICDPNKKYVNEEESKRFFQTICDFVNKDNYKSVKKAFDNSKTFFRFLNNCYFHKVQNMGINSMCETYADIFKLSYTLGAFDDDQIVRQKACEFLNNIFNKKKLSFRSIHGIFESMTLGEYDKEWAEFFMKNFDELMKIENGHMSFIAYVHDSFNEIREFGRSNRGEQNYRKVTVNMCLEYMSKVNFKGGSERDEDISQTISLYTRDQEAFDNAVEIRNEYLKLKSEGMVSEHILDEHLFDVVDKTRKKVCDDVKETLSNLSGFANREFSYEFLSKYDSNNFILGKYCTCCAHIEGAGYGIMRASIVSPDCQNIVVRDKNGKIIAKSTLFINRRQGYGVLNNFEVNNSIKDDKTLEMIYAKFKKAIIEFVDKYNESNKNNPISQINVGMNLNDLEDQIKSNDTCSKQILNGIHFSTYGKDGKRYDGDWKNEQFVFWKKKKMR